MTPSSQVPPRRSARNRAMTRSMPRLGHDALKSMPQSTKLRAPSTNRVALSPTSPQPPSGMMQKRDGAFVARDITVARTQLDSPRSARFTASPLEPLDELRHPVRNRCRRVVAELGLRALDVCEGQRHIAGLVRACSICAFLPRSCVSIVETSPRSEVVSEQPRL